MSEFWSLWIAGLTITNLILVGIIFYFCNNNDKTDSGTPEGEAIDHVYDDDIYEFNNPLPTWWTYLFKGMFVVTILYLILYPGLTYFGNIFQWASTTENSLVSDKPSETIQINQYEKEIELANAIYLPVLQKYSQLPFDELLQSKQGLKIGQRLFANNCTQCHGSAGKGSLGFPNLTDHDWLYGGDPETIVQTITHGRRGMMLPRGGLPLTDEDIDTVTEYLVKLSGRKFDQEKAAKGQMAFIKGCFACHGMAGTGNQMMGAPNLTDSIWLYGGSRQAIKKTLLLGRNGVMPNFNHRLNEDQIKLIAAYVKSLSLSNTATKQTTTLKK